METLSGVESLSGIEIVEDVAQRVAAALGGHCYLRATDGYQSYSARVTIQLQLKDLDTTQIEKTLTIGQHEPGIPSRLVEVEVPEAAALEVRERSGLDAPSLERDVSDNVPPMVKRRFYAPRAPREK